MAAMTEMRRDDKPLMTTVSPVRSESKMITGVITIIGSEELPVENGKEIIK